MQSNLMVSWLIIPKLFNVTLNHWLSFMGSAIWTIVSINQFDQQFSRQFAGHQNFIDYSYQSNLILKRFTLFAPFIFSNSDNFKNKFHQKSWAQTMKLFIVIYGMMNYFVDFQKSRMISFLELTELCFQCFDCVQKPISGFWYFL